MKLFVDHIRSRWAGKTTGLASEWHLFNCPVFVNNDAIERAALGELELSELPSFAPPYGNFFVESQIPYSDGIRDTSGHLRIRIGQRLAIGFAVFDKLHPELYELDADNSSSIEGCRPLDDSQLRWTLNAFLIAENWSHVPTWFATATAFLDGNGQPLPMLHGETMGYSYVQLTPMFVSEIQGLIQQTNGLVGLEHWYQFAELGIDAAMYTLGMLHCRNIGTEVFEPKRAEAHKYERKWGIPMARYHVLKITGKGRDAGTLIGLETGQKRPLHWVRGHWRTYTDAAPLFGTVTGTFYVHEHIRGSIKAGAVNKDYEVTP